MLKRKPLFLSVLLLFTVFAPPAFGTQPLDTLKEPVDQIIQILNDPQYKDPSKRDFQHDKIWEIVRTIFDFKAISRLTVARYWKKFVPSQKEAFTDVFSQFLGNTYISKVQGEYQNEKVVFLGQKMISESKALVKTKIIREGIETPINYRMYKRKDNWKIYDVKIEGVSLVKNYRDQFRKILLKESPDQLIERVQKKLENQKKKRAADDKG